MKKNVKILILSFALFNISCSSEKSDNGNVEIKAKMSHNGLNKNSNSTISISEFKLNLKEIKFEVDDNNGTFQGEDNVKFKGPFQLDLINGVVNVTNGTLPNLVYDEIDFKMHKGIITGSSAPNEAKSIWIKGMIGNKKFEFWHKFEDKIEVDFDDPNIDLTVNSNSLSVIVNFDLSNMIIPAYLSSAVDTDNDGIYEINPDNIGGDNNNGLADNMKQFFKSFIKLAYN